VVGKKLEKPRSLLLLLSLERRFAKFRQGANSAKATAGPGTNPDYFYVDADAPGMRRTLNVLVSAPGLSLYAESLLASVTESYSIPGISKSLN
jgi:hypothetical protein